jgi:hypothetical protein
VNSPNVNSPNANSPNINDFLRRFNFDNNSFLNSNVVVRPTRQQIQNASRIVSYRDIQSPLSEICPITLERFNPDDMVRQIHSCGHIFCQSAFIEWFDSNVRCPVCRYDIRNYTNNNLIPINTPNNSAITSDDSEPENVVPNLNTSPNLNTPQFNDDIITAISSRLIQSILNPSTNNENNDRFMFDASNNVLFYETILTNNDNLR